MQSLKVGVCGVGYLGAFHAEKYAGMDGVDLVGVVDIDDARAREVAARWKTVPYTDYRDLIGKIQAASIAVSTPAHFQLARDLLEAGVDVLIEKPMTTDLVEADRLLEIAENNGAIIQVGHLERFNSAVTALDGKIRSPRFIESHRLSVYKQRCNDVSVVLDLMIHDIDIILNFVHSEVRGIHAAGIPVISGHVDIANARLEFENGCVANVTASRISMKNERKIRLFQPDAYISVDFAHHEITMVRMTSEGCSSGVPDPAVAPAAHEALIPGMDISKQRFSQGDALQDELRSFVDVVRRRGEPLVTGRMGRDALQIALSIMEQIQTVNHRILE
jgi:predicted dehydrogenase